MARELSLMEHMMCLVSDVVPINFVLTARIQGQFTMMELRDALEKARQKQPLLAVRVVDGDNGRFHFCPPDNPQLSIRLVSRASDSAWEREVEQEIKTLFDWRTGPLVRLVWVQGEAVSELLLVCHHGIADGLSALYVLHDIMQFLGKPDTPVVPLSMLPAAEEILPAAVLRKPAMRTKITLARGGLKLLPLLNRFKKQNTASDFPSEPPDLAFQMISWMLDEVETTAVIQRAKQENTTVHGALGAAFLKTFAMREGEKTGWQRKLSNPVSIRKHLAPPVGEDFGLFIALVETAVICQPERDFWEIAQEIKQKLARDSVAEKVLFPFAMAQYLEPNGPGLELLGDFNNISYDLSITNLGRFNFPVSYSGLELQAIFGPVVTTTANERILGVTTVGGKLCFTFVFQPKDMTLAQAEEIKAQAMAFLVDAC